MIAHWIFTLTWVGAPAAEKQIYKNKPQIFDFGFK